MPSSPLRATVSLDLDDLWTYLKTRGEPRWCSYPTYLPVIVPRVLRLLDQLELRITFFLVGRDADVPANEPLLRLLATHGHEIGNHSYEHDCWLHRYSPEDLDRDIARAETAIQRVTERQPVGFRGPGFSWSPELLGVLANRGYLYDASTLPSIVGPLARMYFLWTAKLTPEQRREREALFGSFEEARRPVRPYRWELDHGRGLLEIPVTTMPWSRLPFHLSYLLYLRSYSWRLMATYLSTALRLCRLYLVEPSFLLHPLDLIGAREAPGLEFFPGMALSVEHKAEVFRYALQRIRGEFALVTLDEFARAVSSEQSLRAYPADRALQPNTRSGRRPTAPSPRTVLDHPSPAFPLKSAESLPHADTEV